MTTADEIIDLIDRGFLKKIKGYLFRQNNYENSLIITNDILSNTNIIEDLKRILIELEIKEIEINMQFTNKINDLTILNQLPFIDGITIIYWDKIDYNELYKTPNLKKYTNNYTSESIKFNFFKKLEEANILWSKGTESILECQNLKKLTLYNFKSKKLKRL